MTGEIGQLALCLALALSLAQALSGFIGGARDHAGLMAITRGASLGVFVFTVLAFGALTFAYVSSDFSVVAVAENSHTAKPLIYKISGVWGNHEGSMLLWLLILTVYSAAIAITGAGGERLNAQALAVQALVAIAFLIFVLLTSNPFLRLYPQPFEGNGLNPLLQDPGLAFHPPLLYLGYVGLSATFSFAAAALLQKRNDAAWVRAARPFALTSWTALTLGIAAGSWWAYYTLGWGGFWFWDPVENASLMPWLVATALFHSMMATERSGAFKTWTLLLAITAFSFSLIGTFLVRSGVLNSVHAFANDPERGLFILFILIIATGGPLALFAWRAPTLSSGAAFDVVSRETGILVNNLLLTVAAAAIFMGVMTPLLLDALEGVKISVGPPYYNIVVLLRAMLLAIIVPFGPMLAWRRGNLRAAVWQLRFAFAAAAVFLLAGLAVASPASARGLIAVTLAGWLIGGAFSDLYRRAGSLRYWRTLTFSAWATALAHGGLGIATLGVAGSGVWNTEVLQVLRPGESLTIAGYRLRLDGTERVQGPNYIADRATVTLFEGDRAITVLHPERRNFPAEGNVKTESAIRTTGISDLYVALSEPREGGAWVIRALVNPLAPFIWIGGVVMAMGGACAVAARVRRSRATRLAGAAVAGGVPT
jgi:cytochrome c-type biogenesis protein CcmF